MNKFCGTFVIKGRTPGAGSCFGDSGGPFVCKINGQVKQFGLSAWGVGTCNGYAGYWAPHMDGGFIQEAINELAGRGGSTKTRHTTRKKTRPTKTTRKQKSFKKPGR